MIRINNLSLKLSNKDILDNINLEIQEGKITVFLGENGSGKTSLFNSFVSINKDRYDGDIFIDDVNIKSLNSKELSKRVSINFQIKPTTSYYVYELLEYARMPYKNLSFKITDSEYELIKYAVELTNIEAIMNRRVDTLSGGERQMVYLAMSIIQDSKYMLFDEPDTYLDITNKNKLFDILKLLNENNHTIALSLHSIETALSIADIIYILDNGKIVGSILKEEFDSETLIEKTFNVKKYIINENNKKIYVIR